MGYNLLHDECSSHQHGGDKPERNLLLHLMIAWLQELLCETTSQWFEGELGA